MVSRVECPSTGLVAPTGWSDDPQGWLLCIGLGLGLSALALVKRLPRSTRTLAFICGQVLALTAPLAAHLDRYVVGRFPTTDKYGSLAFYLDGVHRRMLLDPVGSLEDPAARLIGVHMGHLWLTELFDLWLSPEGAMNLQALLYPVAAWGCASLLFREAGARTEWSVLMAFPYGMGLHLFRDLNCYTIEKSAIFWLPLFCWALLRAYREGGRWCALSGLLYLLMTWTNLYLGAIGAVLAALLSLPVLCLWVKDLAKGVRSRPPPLVWALASCVVMALPLVLWQHALSTGSEALGSPQAFRTRAIADSLSLWPLEWNRLAWWAALSPLGLILFVGGLLRVRKEPLVKASLIGIMGLTLLALGPEIVGQPNPLDWLARWIVPGFWRTAEPESFFHGSWLLLLGVGALGMSRRELSPGAVGILYLLMVSLWGVTVRHHAEFPAMSQKTEVYLKPGWTEQVFGGNSKDAK